MSQAGTKLRRARGTDGRDQRLLHWCPGCDGVHAIRIAGAAPPVWTFNENYERPTFSPSVLISIDDDEDEHGNELPAPVRRTLCHYFIRSGEEINSTAEMTGQPLVDPAKSYIVFCGDSQHHLSGQTVPLPDWPYAQGTYGGIDD